MIHLAFGAIAALLLLPAVFGDRSGGLPRRFLAHPVVAWLGLISYGIFLWHYVVSRHLGGRANLDPVLLLITTLAITIPCAAASYYLVERPLLRLKYRRLRDVMGCVRGVRQVLDLRRSACLSRVAANPNPRASITSPPIESETPEPGEDCMRPTFALPIVTFTLVASLLAGCGSDDDSNGNTNGNTTTATTAASPVCADVSNLRSAASDFKQLDASTASANEVKQAIFTLGTSAQALATTASEAAGPAKASLKSAVSSFQSELKSAVDQPVSQQLVALGTAIGDLESSLSQAARKLDCNP